MEECPQLLQPDKPTVMFDETEPRWKEVEDIIRKARGASAPGLNGLAYRLYKSCPRLARRLWKHRKVEYPVYRAHRTPNPDHQGGKGQQGRPSCVVVRPGQHLQVDFTTAGQLVLQHYHIPEKMCMLLQDYFDRFRVSHWEITQLDGRGWRLALSPVVPYW